ncbi:MAG: winged helix-turn-helix domain-containing protein [Candidatus Bathyarchaeia archaeon]
MPIKNTTFRVKLISGGRITIPTAVRELLEVKKGDYLVCSVKPAEVEELPPLKTLWHILDACRRGLTSKEITRRCRLSARASRSYLSLLVGEGFLSVSAEGEADAGQKTYQTTERGLQIINLVAPIRGSRR